jgi:hypothetical protein
MIVDKGCPGEKAGMVVSKYRTLPALSLTNNACQWKKNKWLKAAKYKMK